MTSEKKAKPSKLHAYMGGGLKAKRQFRPENITLITYTPPACVSPFIYEKPL